MIRPGHGAAAARRGSLFSPNGTGLTCSETFLPPPRTGRRTASCPSMACTRMAARATRSLIMVSPQSASWWPVARTTWSGTRRSAAMPPGAYSSSSPVAARAPSSCQRTRLATPAAVSSPSCRHSLLLWLPSAQLARTCTRTQVSPRAARPACSCSASALAANTTGSARGSGGSNSRVTDASATGGRAMSGRASRPRASRCAASPASPNLLATSLAGSAARSPSVPRPSRVSSLIRSWPARSWPKRSCSTRTVTGCAARNPAVLPGGIHRIGPTAPESLAVLAGLGGLGGVAELRGLTGLSGLAGLGGLAGLAGRAARRAANRPSAIPARDSTPSSATAAMIWAASAVSPPK